MATIDQLRALFPDASSDADVLHQASSEFGIPVADIASEVGYGPKGGLTRQQLSASVDQYQAGLYGVGEAAAGALGASSASKWLKKRREENELEADLAAQHARDMGAVDQWKDVHGVGDFGSYAKGLAIQSLPYAAEAIAGGALARGAMAGTRAALGAATAAKDVEGVAAATKALNRGSLAGATAASYPSSVGDVLQNQREQAGETDLGAAAALGVPYAALNALGETGLLAKGSLPKNPINLLDSMTGLKGGLARGGAALAKTGAEEAIGETGQEMINQMGRIAVDKQATMTDPEALERYKESAIGGFALGGLMGGATGWRRSQENTNEIASAMGYKDSSQPSVTTADFPPPTQPAPLAAAQHAPAVQGGTTDVALAQQQAQAEEQKVQAAQQQQAVREKMYTEFGIANPEDPTKGNLFGKPLFGPVVPQVADALAVITQTMTPVQLEITQAVNKASAETGGKLLNFQFNATDPAKSVQKAFEAVGKVATAFQIGHVQTVQEAAQILNEQSRTLTGNKLDQLNAIHQALTGEDTVGYQEAQQTKAEKGAKNGKLQLQQQTTTGLGTVPVQGNAGEAGAGGNGPVRSAEVQPVGTASVGAGSLGLQTGQLPAEGIRASATGDATASDVGQPTPHAQVSEATNAQPATETTTAAEAPAERTAAPRGEPVAPSGEVLENTAEATLDNVPALVRNILRMVYPKAGEGRIELYAAFMAQKAGKNTQTESQAELAKRYGLKESTVKDYINKDLKLGKSGFPLFIERDAEKFRAALEFQANKMGISLDELSTALESTLESSIADSEAAGIADEVDMIVNGMAIQTPKERIDAEGNKTGKIDLDNRTSLAEEGKTMESLMQQYLDLSNELEAATEANDARVEELQAQVDALTVKIAEQEKAEKRRVRQMAGKKSEKEEPNAVQEQSTGKVDVRQPAGNGEALGEGNAKPEKPAGTSEQVKTEAEPETKVEPKQEEVKTPTEQWAELAAATPGMPAYETLTAEQQSRWDDLARRGVANLAAANKLVTSTSTSAKAETSTETSTKLASRGKPFMDNLVFDDLDSYVGGMEMVRSQMEESGIGDAVDLVDSWELTNDPAKDAEHGSLRTVQGRYVGTLNIAKLNNASYAAEVARHEIAHAIDMGPHGGIYSAQPEMGVSVANGQIRAEGPVAKELFALYQNNKDWNNFLAYPFNSTEHPELNNRTKVQLELFAQAFSIYTTPEGRARMEAEAPITAAYFKEVIQDVKSTKPLQVQKVETAARRTTALYTRRQSKGNRGPSKVLELDERVDELLASRSRQFQEGLENHLPAGVVKPAKSAITNLLTAAKNGLLSAGITEDIVAMASKYMRSANDYLAAQFARQKTRLEFEMRIEAILDAFDKLPKHLQGEGAGSVNRYILDSTMSKKWGFYPGEHRIGTTLFETDPDLEKRFNEFPPAAQQIIRDVFEHGYVALKAKQAAIDAAIDREFAERERDAAGDADAMDEVAAAKKLMRSQLTRIQNIDFTTPYAYLGRYGDYVVAAKSKEFKHWEERAKANDFDKERAISWLAENSSNPDHYVVQFAETQGEADQIAADLMATGLYDMDGSEAGPKEAIASYVGSDVHLAVARLRNLITRKSGEEGEGSAELNRMISDLYLMTAAESSARKSEIMRKYVSGANANMMRNLATSGRADAHFLSTMQHNDAITESLENMRNEAKRNVREAMPLYNELFTRQTNSLDYKPASTLSRALTQATSVWFLATSPAFYLQQSLQTLVLSLPYMAGRLGYFRSFRAIKAAYNDTAALVKGLGVNDHIDFAKAPADVRAMLQTLVGMGKIDIGIDADAKARAGEHGVTDVVMRKLQGVNNRIEAINRATAAIAAYRGYIQRHGVGSAEAATKFAAEVVSNTHGSYDGFNTPRILNNDTGRLVGQFKRFQIIQLSMLGKLIANSFKGANQEERMVARRALAFITGHMAVLGGALGVPFVQQVGNALLAVFGDDDEPKDLEYLLRQAIGDKTMADLLLNGIPAAMGVNLGGKLGMGNVASILPFTDVDLSSRSGYEKVLVGMMGPFFGGLAPKFIDGFGMMGKGEYYKGLELLMPSGIGNAMKGVRYANEGVTMRNGDVVLKPEEISMMDAAFQAVGLPTTTITGRQYTQRVAAEFDKFYADKATEIKGSYVNAQRAGDTAGMADARKEWEDLQTSRRKNGYTTQPMSELFKATIAARQREANVVKGVEAKKSNKQFVQNII